MQLKSAFFLECQNQFNEKDKADNTEKEIRWMASRPMFRFERFEVFFLVVIFYVQRGEYRFFFMDSIKLSAL
jgi:hypothetical protein